MSRAVRRWCGRYAREPRLRLREATTAGLLLLSKADEPDIFSTPGFLLFYYGVVGAPSAGSFYARDLRRAQAGLAIRSAGAALVTASGWRHFLSSGLEPDREPHGWDALNVTGAVIMAGEPVKGLAWLESSRSLWGELDEPRRQAHASLYCGLCALAITRDPAVAPPAVEGAASGFEAAGDRWGLTVAVDQEWRVGKAPEQEPEPVPVGGRGRLEGLDARL